MRYTVHIRHYVEGVLPSGEVMIPRLEGPLSCCGNLGSNISLG